MKYKGKLSPFKEKLLVLAYDIKHDFDTIMVAEIPMYQESGRYKELLEMINEIKAENLKPHPDFDYGAGMGSDEITTHRELWGKMRDFKRAFNSLV